MYIPGNQISLDEPHGLVLTAVWEPRKTHQVTYDIDGGSLPAPVQDPVAEGSAFVLQNYSGTKQYYTFGGWMYQNRIYSPGLTLVMSTSDITLVAYWVDVRYYSVTYDADGGSAVPPTETPKPGGFEITVQGYDGTKEGYAFRGWISSGLLYRPGDELVVGDRDVLLVAKWVPVRKVTYDLNGGEGDVPVQDPVAQGDSFKVQGCTAVRDGYRFAWWVYNGAEYGEGDPIKAQNEDIVLTAYWSLILDKHSVSYDIQGGSGEAPSQEDVEERQRFIVKGYEGSKDGCVFAGWSFGGSVYLPGDTIEMGPDDIVLVAVWNPLEYDAFTTNMLVFVAISAVIAVV